MTITTKMDAAQLRFARELLDKAYGAKQRALKAQHTTLGVKLNFEQMQVALCEGRFTADLPAPSYRSSDPSARDLVTFTDETPTVTDDEALSADLAALESRHRTLTEDLVLGGASEALAAIRQFASDDAA